MSLTVGTAVLAAGALTAGAAVYSSSQARKAAGQQNAATGTALNEQQREFNINQSNEAPYLAAGQQALGQYQTAINTPTTAADVMANDPGYQFGLGQGQTALDRKIAAMGGRVSGAALKATDQYATNYATTGYNSAYQRSQDRLNRLASLANLGQTATGASAAAGQASTNAMTGLVTSQGDANAASTLAQGGIWGSAGNQLAALATNYAKNYGGGTSNPTSYGSTGAVYGGIGSGYYDENGSDTGGFTLSDIRAKTDIVPLGIASNGLPLYEFTYIGGGSRQIGHMAHEVAQRFPDAVTRHSSGLLMVDYSKV